MPRRIFLIATLAAVSMATQGCQDYNFNPVGSCIIQPGAEQQTLSDVSTADILFVVDDSGSMDPKQQALANNFDIFINELNQFNIDRVSAGQDPFDFHIAVTTSAIFRNYQTGKMCVSGSPEQCCSASSCSGGCTTPGASCGAGRACVEATAGSGNLQCCAISSCVAPGGGSCVDGYECGAFSTSYENPLVAGCTQGVAVAGAPYPAGDFVAAGTNPKVLHFTKDLYLPSPNIPAITALSDQFKQNILVGSCGSGQEQHLQAARLAVQKALAGQQPGVAAGEWPHSKSKLVVVFVADEDDCSNPADPDVAIVLRGGPGADTCVSNRNPAGQPVQYAENDFHAFFASLGRPFGAAFIVSATCSGGTCTPSTCVGSGGADGYSAGPRLLNVAQLLQSSFQVFEGSVCDPFAATLLQIADLVKPVNRLNLPSLPASNEITVLRIVRSDGTQRKVCTQETTPGPVADPATAGGWWFADCADSNPIPAVSAAPTTCIYINLDATIDANKCEASPGDTYSAEYLGQLPPGGCPSPSVTPQPSQFCAEALLGPGAEASTWDSYSCYGPAGAPSGTCICVAP